MAVALRIRALNTAPDSENKIHDDSVAVRYGFRGGLVPGVTIYGYVSAPIVEHFGSAWLNRGAIDIRLHKPAYDDDEIEVSLQPESDDKVSIKAGECASATAWLHNEIAPPAPTYAESSIQRRDPSVETLAPGTVLGTVVERLDLAQSRISAPLAPSIGPERFAQPAILLHLANQIFLRNYKLGPWIHAASEIRNFGAAQDGDELRVRGLILDRYERKGHEFVVLDIVLVRDSSIIQKVRHTAIWRLRGASG